MATPAVVVPDDITAVHWPKTIDRRDQWSRWRVRKMLAKTYTLASNKTVDALPKEIQDLLPPEISSNAIPAQKIPKLPEFKPEKTPDVLPSEMKVCIVGAGAAGLFTAMILDWLEEKVEAWGLQKLNISYDIFEANGEERLGGRLYTYKFPPTEKYTPGDHDYYDVGAMRFPEIPIMKRTFDLFEYLRLHKKSKKHPHENGRIIRYYMKGKNDPSCFNDIHYIGPPPYPDPYDWASQTGAPIPPEYLQDPPTKTLLKAIKVYRDAFVESEKKGWKMLMDADQFSARDFLMLPPSSQLKTVQNLELSKVGQDDDSNPIGGPGFNFNTVEWLETFEAGTRWYSQAFSEMVLESLAFNFPTQTSKDAKGSKDSENSEDFDDSDDPQDSDDADDSDGSNELDDSTKKKKKKKVKWWCIDGGANVLAQEMAKKIKGKIQYNKPVTSIAWEKADQIDGRHVTHNINVGLDDTVTSHKYAAVFNSTTLGALQRMNLTAAGLNLGTKQAIRTLNYGAASKVAIWFSKPWWMLPPYNINRGGLGTTDLPIRVCVYPSYNLPPRDKGPDDDEYLAFKSKPAVLLCSYTWEQDASRLGSMITKDSPIGEGLLRKVLFDNLARLHASKEHPFQEVYETIKESYIAHHAFNWYQDEYSAGAFAFFGPSQFKEVWPDLTAPSADGKLLFIGEAASSHHAWVVGALESALRGVYQFISRYAQLFPEYKAVMEHLEKEKDIEEKDIEEKDRPFLPLPLSFEKEMAKQQVVLSQARANGLKDRLPVAV